MDSAGRAPIRSRFDRWKMESFNSSNRNSVYHCDRRQSASSNRSNASARSDIKNGDNFNCNFHGYSKYSALWNRSSKCIVCVSFDCFYVVCITMLVYLVNVTTKVL